MRLLARLRPGEVGTCFRNVTGEKVTIRALHCRQKVGDRRFIQPNNDFLLHIAITFQPASKMKVDAHPTVQSSKETNSFSTKLKLY